MTNLDGYNLKLGQKVNDGTLDAVPRHLSRAELPDDAAFEGHDLWNAYEVSFLLPTGKPVVYHMQAIIAATSKNIIESKSFKLFLNSFNFKTFENLAHFRETIVKALSECAEGEVELRFYEPERSPMVGRAIGLPIDQLEPTTLRDKPDAGLLKVIEQEGPYAFKSHLLRSNCPVTNQPDWGTVLIQGSGEFAPVPSSLLDYIIAFRNHQDFHESCCERIFVDLHRILQPTRLTVHCFYTRRGGLDINPVRSMAAVEPWTAPLWRQ